MKNFESIVLRWLPLLGPAPIAWTVFDAAVKLLGWPWPVALAGAVFVEGMGFSSINLAVRMGQFNAMLWEKERGHFTAPTGQARAAVGLYALTALLLAVLLEIVPGLRVWSPTSFILMSLTGGFLWSLYRDQEQRESEHAQKREKDRQARSKPRGKKGSAKADLAQSVRNAAAVRSQCEQLATQYACAETQCGWTPDVDALAAVAQKGKDPRRSAASAKAGHYKSKHPKPVALDPSLLIRQDGEK